jgi:hypothetical protein
MDMFRQSAVGEKPGGGVHKVDWELVSRRDRDVRGLVSCKAQSSSGTAEEKLAYEVIKLLHTMKHDSRYRHAWLMMGGDGFSDSIRGFVTNHLHLWVPAMQGRVTVLDTADKIISADIRLPDGN